MKSYLIYQDEKSNKFWKIETNEKSFTVTYGKVGTAGQSQTKEFETEEKCLKEAEKLVKEKANKGYVAQSEGTKQQQDEKPPKPTASKSKSYSTAKIEKHFGVELPERFKNFIDSGEYEKYNGLYCCNLPGYTADSKFKMKFDQKMLLEIMEESDIEMPDDEDNFYIPLSLLGEEPQFIAVNISKGNVCPVAMWEHEDGLFHEMAPCFDDFLKSLLKKGEKTPHEKLEKALNSAHNLLKNNKDNEILAVLEEASKGLDLDSFKSYEETRMIGSFYNYKGLAYMHLKNYNKAIENLTLAHKNHSERAVLNLIVIYIYRQPDFVKALEITDSIDSYDAYVNYHQLNYKGYLHILLGDKTNAEKTYREILKDYAIEEPAHIDYSITDLNEIINDKKPNADLAKDILTWFNHKTYDLTPAEIKENKKWWNSLDKYGDFWKKRLKEAIKLEKEPDDNDISKMLEVESLTFGEKELIHDAEPFKIFKNLKRVNIYGDLESLEVFKNMKGLERLTYNGNINKNFQVPSRINIDFIEAAMAGDMELMKSLLQKGAIINSREKYGCTALMEAVMNRHEDLALYLIENAADPYLQNGDDSDVFAYCGPEMKEKLEKAIREKGIVRKESPFRVVKESYKEKNVCKLGYLKNVECAYEMTHGSRSENFPENASFAMEKDYPGYKKDTKLVDCFLAHHFLVGNEKVKAFFIDKKISNIEILPVTILDHAGKVIGEPYYIINPLAQSCLDIEASIPTYNHINGSINEVTSFVIDESHLPKDMLIFRVKEYFYDIVLRKELAIQIEAAGFTGIKFKEPKR